MVREAGFSELKEKTGATSGNLSVQITKWQETGYIQVVKSFKNNYPLTTCMITEDGVRAFDGFYDNLKGYFNQQAFKICLWQGV